MALVIASNVDTGESRVSLLLTQSMPHLYQSKRRQSSIDISQKWKLQGDVALISTLSALYCKLIVLLGVALPVIQAITPDAKHTAYDGFYLYLYLGSMMFLTYMYVSTVRDNNVNRSKINSMIDLHKVSCQGIREDVLDMEASSVLQPRHQVRYGSFYLCMGVAGFGIGSMIYSVLEAGQYLELKKDHECNDFLIAISPIFRVAFVLMQMIFIFSNNHKLLEMYKYKAIARFGLMHMIATNLCEWLYVLVAETKNDILRFFNQRETSGHSVYVPKSELGLDHTNGVIIIKNGTSCWKTHIMPTLLENATPFLFPCIVEYSLLCAVILAVIWKNGCEKPHRKTPKHRRSSAFKNTKEKQSGVNVIYTRSISKFSVDCASAHKGLFSGILILVLSIISLIMFFELVSHPRFIEIAVLQVNVWETFVFLTSAIAAVSCAIIIKKVGLRDRRRKLELEHILLFVTQSGVFLYFLFQIIGGYFSLYIEGNRWTYIRIITPLAALVQSVCQTVLILDAWKRRCNSIDEMRRKPGRQLVTFLLIANLAMWVVNRVKNNRAEFHPMLMNFYGVWAWTIITHVSMPLVVCFRFQSTVCLYEIWKHVYKMRPTDSRPI